MRRINYYLRDPHAKAKTAILCKFSYGVNGYRKTAKFSMRESIAPNNWDFKRQRPKVQVVLDKLELNRIKRKLNRSEDIIENFLSKCMTDGELPMPGEVKAHLETSLAPQGVPLNTSGFMPAFDEFIAESRGLRSPRTTQKYQGLQRHLMVYCLSEFDSSAKFSRKDAMGEVRKRYDKLPENRKISFNGINLDFYTAYKKFMLAEQKLDDTIGKHFSTLKTFMEWARIKGYHNTSWYKHPNFKATKKLKNENYVLSELQLEGLREYDFDDDVVIARVRDLFVFMCYTGQRWQDYENFRPGHVKGQVWEIYVSKTKAEEGIKIPMVGYLSPAKQILEKYGGNLPSELDGKPFSSQRFNKLIKEAARVTGYFGEEYRKVRYSGVHKTEVAAPQYNFITQYSARRTFCTILGRKLPLSQLQMLTGHKQIQTLMKYINDDIDDISNTLISIG